MPTRGKSNKKDNSNPKQPIIDNQDKPDDDADVEMSVPLIEQTGNDDNVGLQVLSAQELLKAGDGNSTNLLLSSSDTTPASANLLLINNGASLMNNDQNINFAPTIEQPVLDDFISKDLKSGGLNVFDYNKTVVRMLKTYHSELLEPLICKIMSTHPGLKRAEIFNPAKFCGGTIPGIPRATTDGIIQEDIRLGLQKKVITERLACSYFVRVGIIVNNFFTKFGMPDRLVFTRRLGCKAPICARGLNLVKVVEETVRETTFRSQTLAGFDYYRYNNYQNVGSVSNHKKRRNDNIDWKQFKDPTNPRYVPKGYCIWHHRFARGCNKGAKCQHKHSMWSAEELEASKKN